MVEEFHDAEHQAWLDSFTDLGSGYSMKYMQWSPDRKLNPQYEGIPDVPKYGIIVRCPHENTGLESGGGGSVIFHGEVADLIDGDRAKWVVESWDPLTLSPSILMKLCGCHGWIKEGRWVT
jgi:hypothetical protein